MRLTTIRRHWATLPSAGLLVLRGLGGGAVVLAHAAEVPTAPAALEAPHHSDCVVVHDALRCAVCHVVAVGVRAAAPHVERAAEARQPARPAEPDETPARADRTRTTPPRAPPALVA